MTQEQKQFLTNILKQNNMPLIVEGVSSVNFPTAVVVPATINSAELGVIPTEYGIDYPLWLQEIIKKSKKSKNVLLAIDGLENISFEEQEKFYGIIKYNGVNGLKFPENTQIVIPVNKPIETTISKKIRSLCINYKVDR